MKPERYLLDTSALLTFIEDEAGADRVEHILTGAEVQISWLTLLETHYISHQELGEAEADRRYVLIKQLQATILWDVTEPILLTAARFKALYRLSLADTIIAAFAFHHNATLLHKDPEFETLAGQVQLEALPYK